MNGILRRRTTIKYYSDTLSPEKRKLLHDANLEALNELYERCYEEGIPRNALIDAIEKEIYIKTIKEGNWKIDRIYRPEPRSKRRNRDENQCRK